MKRTFWMPLTLAVLALFACNRGKSTTPAAKPTPVKTTPEPAAEKNYSLSGPMDQVQVVTAYRKAAAELDAVALAGTELDLGDFLLKLGLEARGGCAAGGRLIILRPAELVTDDSDPTARGLIAGFVDTETGECGRNMGFCSISITKEKSGKFHLRAADMVLKIGHSSMTVSGEYPLGKSAWAMVLTDEETASCKALATPEKTGSDEESEDSGMPEGSQPDAMQEVLLFVNGEFHSLAVEPGFSFVPNRRFTIEDKVDLSFYAVGNDVLPGVGDTWILAAHRTTTRVVTGEYEEDESGPRADLKDEIVHEWSCDKITTTGKRERLSPAEADKLLGSTQYSHLKCGQRKSDLEEEDSETGGKTL